MKITNLKKKKLIARTEILRLAAASLLTEEEKINVRVFYLPDLNCIASNGVRFQMRVTTSTEFQK